MKNREYLEKHLTDAAGLAAALIIPLSTQTVTGAFDRSETVIGWLTIALSAISAALFMIGKNRRNYSLRSLPVTILLLIIYASCLSHRGTWTEIRIYWTTLSAMCWISFMILFSGPGTERIRNWLSASLAITTIWQAFIVLKQSAGSSFCLPQSGSFTNPGLLGCFLCVSLPLLAHEALYRQAVRYTGPLCFMAALTGFIILPLTQSRASMLALAICLVTWLLQRSNKKMALIIVSAGMILGTAAYFGKRESADIRLYMNHVAWKLIREKPVLGNGPGSFPSLYAEYQFSKFSSGNFTERERLCANTPASCCNELLETGIEYGIPAMLLACTVFIHAAVLSFRHSSEWRFSLIAWAVFSLFSYPASSFLLRYAGVIALAGCTTCPGTISKLRLEGPVAASILSGATALLMGLGMLFSISRMEWLDIRIKSTHEFQLGQTWFENGNYRSSARDWERLSGVMAHNSRFLLQYGISLNQIGEYSKSDSVLQLINGISSDPMRYIVMGDNSMSRKEFASAESYYRKAFLTVPNRILPLASLAALHEKSGDTVRYAEMVDSIRSFVPKIDNSTFRNIREHVLSDFETRNERAHVRDENMAKHKKRSCNRER